MKIAYFIMAHHKPEHLLRLLDSIYSEHNLYLIHIDSKAQDDMFQLARQLKDNPNIHFLPSRSMIWGGWSLVQAEIDAMRYLLADPSWTTYINLSGQDFPLVSQEKMVEYMDSRCNYLRFLGEETKKVTEITGRYYYVEDMGKIELLGERKPFHFYFEDSVQQYRGSQWKILNRDFVQYVVTSEFSHHLQDYYRYTYIPDEEFFHTLIMNSEYRSSVISSNKRYIKGMYSKEGVNFSAMDLTLSDIGAMYNSDALFARKFNDTNVLDMLEQIINESRQHSPIR